MQLIVLHEGSWVEADVVSPPKGNWKSDHQIRLLNGGQREEGPGVVVTLQLHPFNHAPRLMPVSSYAAARSRHERAMRTQHATVADALSGKRLDVQKQMVPIRMSMPPGEDERLQAAAAALSFSRPSTGGGAGGGGGAVAVRGPSMMKRAPTLKRLPTHSFKAKRPSKELSRQMTQSFLRARGTAAQLRTVDGVKALSAWFEDSYQRRVAYPETAGGACVFITANPAAGKTCLMSQLVVESLANHSELVPVFLKVQQLAKLLK